MSPDIRLFGINFGNKIYKIDDADYKISLIMHNLNWGTSLSDICQFINKQLLEANLGMKN